MGMWVGRGRKARAAYGFDDIALVPGALTINPSEVDISWELCGRRFEIPIIAAAMDGVVSPSLAIEMGRLGGPRRPQPRGHLLPLREPRRGARPHHLRQPRRSDQDHPGHLRRAHQGRADPQAHLARSRRAADRSWCPSIPQRAERFAKIAEEAGADFFVVQSTVTTARHVATEYTPVDLPQLKKHLSIPLIVGNVVTYEACLELMETAASTRC